MSKEKEVEKLHLVRDRNGTKTIWDLHDCSETGYVLVDLTKGKIHFNYTPKEAK